MKVYAFIGKTGAGKSTLIRHAFPDSHTVDVWLFLRNYLTDGFIPEAITIAGYQDVYQYVHRYGKDSPNANIVIELGANHAAFNISELKRLQQEGDDVYIFLCIASIATCRERARHKDIFLNDENMERSLQRDFPNPHLSLLQSTSLPYIILNTEQSMLDNLNIIKSCLHGGITE